MTVWTIRDTKKKPDPEIDYYAIGCILLGVFIGFVLGYVVA